METPWIGKDAKTQRPMYEIEIALLRGDVEGRFGQEFLNEVEQLQHFFKGKELDSRAYVLDVWTLLKMMPKPKSGSA